MRFKKRLLSVVLVVILCSGMSMTAYATPENQSTDELTPEQQAWELTQSQLELTPACSDK